MNYSTGSGNININVGVVPNTAQAKKDFKQLKAELEKSSDVKLNVKLDSNGNFKTVVRTYTNQAKELVEITEKYNLVTGEVDRSITKVQKNYGNLTNATRQQQQAQQQLNNTTKQSKTIFSDFADTFLKMAKFNTINIIYDGLTNKMAEAIQITNEFDAAMTEFKKVTDTSSLSLTDYTEKLGELGETTARTTTQMLEAATEFSKGGYDAETSAQLAQTASLFQNIADSELSAGDAASFIISQMKAFNIQANQATSILDKVNEVKLFVTS